ncbi:hypothetical protein GCM10010345_94320 [Streptomyces canarius]|uniref:Uncharacterized protein n=1 Tax=Streptomyces canarius TaxID=285453 RepID=A0ABQ3DF08_9ACTN|nr:hypothetical protein GCM10010345_94320 [Streptomyces canarius]
MELPSVTSVHKGRPLRRFALEFHVPDERHRELDAELEAAAANEADPLHGTDAAWRGSEDWSDAAPSQPSRLHARCRHEERERSRTDRLSDYCR